MREIEVAGVRVVALTDVEPPPADWAYAFASHVGDIDAPARLRWAPDGRFHTRFTVHALVRDGAVTLVDAGLGPEATAYFNGLHGSLAAELAAAGIAPESVGCVMLTHLHLDHVGWLGSGGAPFFPNATHVVPAAELAHWQAHGAAAALPHHVAAFERHVAPLVEQGLLTGLAEGEPAPGGIPLHYLALPGHTPGHAAVVLDERGGSLAIAGDAWHSPAQIERPDWCHRADRDPAAATASRITLARWAADREALVAAGHFPEASGFGRIVSGEAGGLRWQPLG